MVSHNFLKFCIISFLTYLQVSVLYNSNYTLWAGFDYDNHEYKYTVFVPNNNSNMVISACQDNTCKVLTESPYQKLTWIQLFEREFNVHFENNTNGNYRENRIKRTSSSLISYAGKKVATQTCKTTNTTTFQSDMVSKVAAQRRPRPCRILYQ